MFEKEKEKDYEKVIKDVLSRKDEQNVITQFYGALFLCTLLFFILNVLEIFFLTQTYTKIKENMKLMINLLSKRKKIILLIKIPFYLLYLKLL